MTTIGLWAPPALLDTAVLRVMLMDWETQISSAKACLQARGAEQIAKSCASARLQTMLKSSQLAKQLWQSVRTAADTAVDVRDLSHLSQKCAADLAEVSGLLENGPNEVTVLKIVSVHGARLLKLCETESARREVVDLTNAASEDADAGVDSVGPLMETMRTCFAQHGAQAIRALMPIFRCSWTSDTAVVAAPAQGEAPLGLDAHNEVVALQCLDKHMEVFVRLLVELRVLPADAISIAKTFQKVVKDALRAKEASKAYESADPALVNGELLKPSRRSTWCVLLGVAQGRRSARPCSCRAQKALRRSLQRLQVPRPRWSSLTLLAPFRRTLTCASVRGRWRC